MTEATVYRARWVLPTAHERIENGAVAVRGTSIVAVGTREEIQQRFNARHKLHRAEAAIMPGMVNTHTHAAMSLYRGLADDLALQEWLEKFIFPAEARNTTARLKVDAGGL